MARDKTYRIAQKNKKKKRKYKKDRKKNKVWQ